MKIDYRVLLGLIAWSLFFILGLLAVFQQIQQTPAFWVFFILNFITACLASISGNTVKKSL